MKLKAAFSLLTDLIEVDERTSVVSEKIGGADFIIIIVFLFVQKHRWIVMRRFFILLCSLFFIHCLMMAMTRPGLREGGMDHLEQRWAGL